MKYLEQAGLSIKPSKRSRIIKEVSIKLTKESQPSIIFNPKIKSDRSTFASYLARMHNYLTHPNRDVEQYYMDVDSFMCKCGAQERYLQMYNKSLFCCPHCGNKVFYHMYGNTSKYLPLNIIDKDEMNNNKNNKFYKGFNLGSSSYDQGDGLSIISNLGAIIPELQKNDIPLRTKLDIYQDEKGKYWVYMQYVEYKIQVMHKKITENDISKIRKYVDRLDSLIDRSGEYQGVTCIFSDNYLTSELSPLEQRECILNIVVKEQLQELSQFRLPTKYMISGYSKWSLACVNTNKSFLDIPEQIYRNMYSKNIFDDCKSPLEYAYLCNHLEKLALPATRTLLESGYLDYLRSIDDESIEVSGPNTISYCYDNASKQICNNSDIINLNENKIHKILGVPKTIYRLLPMLAIITELSSKNDGDIEVNSTAMSTAINQDKIYKKLLGALIHNTSENIDTNKFNGAEVSFIADAIKDEVTLSVDKLCESSNNFKDIYEVLKASDALNLEVDKISRVLSDIGLKGNTIDSMNITPGICYASNIDKRCNRIGATFRIKDLLTRQISNNIFRTSNANIYVKLFKSFFARSKSNNTIETKDWHSISITTRNYLNLIEKATEYERVYDKMNIMLYYCAVKQNYKKFMEVLENIYNEIKTLNVSTLNHSDIGTTIRHMINKFVSDTQNDKFCCFSEVLREVDILKENEKYKDLVKLTEEISDIQIKLITETAKLLSKVDDYNFNGTYFVNELLSLPGHIIGEFCWGRYRRGIDFLSHRDLEMYLTLVHSHKYNAKSLNKYILLQLYRSVLTNNSNNGMYEPEEITNETILDATKRYLTNLIELNSPEENELKLAGAYQKSFVSFQPVSPMQEYHDIPAEIPDIHQVLTQLVDCRKMIETLELKATYSKYPSRLDKQHNDIVKTYNALITSADSKSIDKIITKVARSMKDYENKDDKYQIIFPKTARSIVLEGHNLHHCVGSYVNRVVRGESIIGFVRDKDKLEESLYTFELDPSTLQVVQFKASYDRTPVKSAIKFLSNTFSY